jgi:hypothetical protein
LATFVSNYGKSINATPVFFSFESGITRMPVPFTYQDFPFVENFGVDVSSNDILFNDIDQTSFLLGLNGIPWHHY